MRLVMFLLCCMVLPVFLTAGVITHEFQFSSHDLSFSSYEGYDVVQLRDGVSNLEVGHPLIPFIVANFVLPPGSEVTSVRVVSRDEVEVGGVYDLCPVQTPRPFSYEGEVPFVGPDPLVYSSPSLYPGEDIEWFPTGSMSGYRIAGIFLYPLQYLPLERRLLLSSSMVVELEYEEGVHEILALTPKQVEVFSRSVGAIVENVGDVGRFSPPEKANPSRACDYAIITNSSHSATWQRLANWKNSGGYTAQVFTTSWIYSNYTGSDNQERIRNFLKDYFTTEGLIYAVLAGDVAIVPERDAFNYAYDPNYLASDYYYSDLDGNWDGDGDGWYGEIGDGVDGYYDIFVGRPSSDDTIDIKSFLHKDSVYVFAAPANFIQKILLPSEQLWSNYHGRVVNNAIGDMFPSWTVTKLEDGNAYPPHTRNEFNNNYNLMHISAHGSTNGTSVFTSSDVPYLTNTMPTIMNAISCYSGNFDGAGDCFAEQLIDKSDGAGCVAVAMNSRYGWGTPPSMGPSEKLDTTFFSVMLNDSLPVGIVHAATKNHHRNLIWNNALWHYCGTELNLFGDPEMPIRLTASSEPYIDISAKELNDDNGNGTWEPGEYAELVVTLYNGGGVSANNVQAVLRATNNGQYVTISDSTSSFGSIAVCGSADNAADPYKITADGGTPSGTPIEFTLHITADGGHSWDPAFIYIISFTYFDHDIGNVRFTVTNKGICGFTDEAHTQGSGFSYPLNGNQHLYIGSVWAGNNPAYVVNRDYAAENSGDWEALAGVYGDGTVYSDQDSWAKFSDEGMNSPKGLTCTQDGWAWSSPGSEDFVILRYIFRSEGMSAVNSLFFGQFMDWNAGGSEYNTGDVDLSRDLIYQHGTATKYVGIALLEPDNAVNISFVNNATYVDPDGYILDSDKDWFLKSILSTQTASSSEDWSMVISAGPKTILPGDSVIFAVAVLAGEDLADIQENCDSARARYGLVGIEKEPGAQTPLPSIFAIQSIYPQPFARSVTIEYAVPRAGALSICIYDITGRLVSSLPEPQGTVGTHRVQWDGKTDAGRAVTSGVYFIRLMAQGGELKATKKVLLIR